MDIDEKHKFIFNQQAYFLWLDFEFKAALSEKPSKKLKQSWTHLSYQKN